MEFTGDGVSDSFKLTSNTENYSMNEPSPDRSLSPVLSAGKISRRHVYANRLHRNRSKQNLCKKFQNEPTISSHLERIDMSNVFSENDSLEDRIRKAEEIKNRRAEFYDFFCSSNENQGEDEQRFEFKKPSSPFNKKIENVVLSPSGLKINNNTFISEKTNKLLEEVKVNLSKSNELIKKCEEKSCSPKKTCVKNNATVHSDTLNDTFIKELYSEITDTQINLAVDNILNKEISKNEYLLSTQETDSYFKNFLTPTEQIEDKTPISPITTLDYLNSHCKNILNAIELVEKKNEVRATELDDFKGFEKADIEFSKIKAENLKHFADEIYFFGFCEEDVNHSEDSLKKFDKMFQRPRLSSNKRSIFCLNNQNNVFKSRNFLSTESQTSCSNMGDSNYSSYISETERDFRDDIVTIFKNKKRINPEFLLPPKKRLKGENSSCSNNNICSEPDIRSNLQVFGSNEGFKKPFAFSLKNNIQKTKNLHNNETPIINSENIDFKTASNKPLRVTTKEAFKKALNMFDDTKEYTAEESSTATSNFEDAPGNKLKIKEVHDKTNQENQAQPNLGFQTAAGSKLPISLGAMKKAQKMYAETAEENQAGTSEEKSTLNSTYTGFHRASGGNLSITNDAMKKALHMYEEIAEENRAATSNEECSLKSPYKGFKKASGGKLSITNEAMKKALHMYEETAEENRAGTSNKERSLKSPFTASGGKLPITNEAMKKALHMYKDTVEENQLGATLKSQYTGFKKASGGKLSITNEAMKKALHIYKETAEEKDEAKNNLKQLSPLKKNQNVANLGFKSAAGNKISFSEEALKKAQKFYEETAEVILPKSETVSTNTSFKSGSGKFKISKENLERATKIEEMKIEPFNGSKLTCAKESLKGTSKIYSEDKETVKKVEGVLGDIKDLKVLLEANAGTRGINDFGFKSASGNKLKIDEEALKRAQKTYEKTADEVQSFLEADSSAKEERDTVKIKSGVSASEDLFTSKWNGKDFDVNVSKSEILRKSETKTVIRKHLSKGAKKTLGPSSCRQIEVPKMDLERAKLLFEDIDGGASEFAKTTSTPNKSSAFNPIDIQNSPKISPIKSFNGSSNIRISESRISTKAETKGGHAEWIESLRNECKELEKKLELLNARKKALEEQKKMIQNQKDERQIPGTLYLKKTKSKRFGLKELVGSVKPGDLGMRNVSERLLSVAPQNAEYVHFNLKSGSEPVIQTEDKAIVVPNNAGYVGITEIEAAFQTSPGVSRNLLPKGWVRNHYKWIVWKLASMERAFPVQFHKYLSVENILLQLKYRYDREIDRAERSALRRILEKDDAPQKRMILCVSDIIRLSSDAYEIELTDGWYSVKTLIDVPLCEKIKSCKVVIGTKLVTQNAELVNCEGCHPLQTPDFVRLKILYNCTRRAAWDTKLGFQSYPGPLPILISTIHPKGGVVGCVKVYVARVYPLRYMEKTNGMIIWRNEKADKRRAQKWEIERSNQVEKIQEQLQEEFVKQIKEISNESRKKLTAGEISKITCPKVLHQLLMNSNDPDSVREMMSEAQYDAVMQFSSTIATDYQQELSKKMSEALDKADLSRRNVTAVLKLTVMDAKGYSEKGTVFNIWNPTTEHLDVLKEGRNLNIYKAVPKSNGTLSADKRTQFSLETASISKYEKTGRQILPIAMTLQSFCKPFFNEFDTVGIVVKIFVEETSQDLWLADFVGRLLHISVSSGPSLCLLFDDLMRSQVVVVSNLILCEPKNSCGFALANQHTLVTKNPQCQTLRTGIHNFIEELPEDLESLLNECDKKIEFYDTSCKQKQTENTIFFEEMFSEMEDDESGLPAHLTAVDLAMSLINTDNL